MNSKLKNIHIETINIVKNVRILDHCSWPIEAEQNFLKSYEKGKVSKIEFDYQKQDFTPHKEALKNHLKSLSPENPLELYTIKTIKSYMHTIDMIDSIGTPRFQELGIEVYGTPSAQQIGTEFCHLEVAKKILKIYKEFDHPYLKEPEVCFSSSQLSEDLHKRSLPILGIDTPRFEEDTRLTSKAAAGKSRVRLRKGTCFTEHDFNQLFEHEVMIHGLTAINGAAQENLPLLGRGAPRTTKTQEGLATFAEIITGSMDIFRLRRLALRIVAIDMALRGANFYELFDFFRSFGQNDKESFLSSSRILRGGTAEGGIVFTKDNVYLEGLFTVHSFFQWCLQTSNLSYIHVLFSGRLDLEDVFMLKDQFKQGYIQEPKYIPNWYKQINLLVGKISFSLLHEDLHMRDIDSHFSALKTKYA